MSDQPESQMEQQDTQEVPTEDAKQENSEIDLQQALADAQASRQPKLSAHSLNES